MPRPTAEALRAAADYLVPVPDVKIQAVEGTQIPTLNVVPRWDYPEDGMVQYIHKVKNGVDVYYFANSSNSDAKFTATLRGSFKWIDLWNPRTGETTRVDQTDVVSASEDGTTTVTLDLPSIESVFVVGEKK